MPEVITMPKMSDTMTTGTIASWLVKVGDTIESGDVIAEVETDKATMDLESPEEGVLLYQGPKERDSIPVNGIVAIIGEAGEAFEHLLNQDAQEVTENTESKKDTISVPPTEDTGQAIAMTMPKMSDTMTVGVISSWLVKEGDEVHSGDVLAEVETDKATMELESYEDGTVLYLAGNKGDEIPVDDVIAVIGEKGASYQHLLNKQPQATTETIQTEPVKKQEATRKNTPPSKEQGKAIIDNHLDKRIKASPLAKKLAQEKGYDLTKIKGSAPNGRIIKRDIEHYQPPQATVQATTDMESHRDQEISSMRRVIAERLSQSKFQAPHFYITTDVNMDQTIAARNSMNQFSKVKISFNDLIVKAAAKALKQHSKVNSSWLGDSIRYYNHVHIGVAVAVDEGLLVPVVRFADTKPLAEIAQETKTLVTKAKEKKLQPHEWEGNTFTVSNLGMFDVESFTAIINPPDAAILAVGQIQKKPIVKGDALVIGSVMKLTLSCDHRVIDGVTGSQFLKTLKSLLEDPVRILV